ncbi:MAG: alanine racemase [Wujia sp.]
MVTLFLDKNILSKNIEISKKLAGSSKIIAVVKGNAYGLDLVNYSRMLVEQGITTLAVTDLEDALALRASGITCDILNLSPVYDPDDIRRSFEQHIIITVTSQACGEAAEKIASAINIPDFHPECHIAIDTGLGRHGFLCSQADLVITTIRNMKHIKVTGIFSHFCSSAYKKDPNTALQLERFLTLCDTLTRQNIDIGCRHIAATCAFLRYPETRLDAVRLGSALVGRIPFPDKWGYKPVGRLEAPVEDINIVPAGQTVGYGHAFTTKKETRIAVIPVGYTHGLGLQRINDCTQFSQIPRFIYHIIKNTLHPDIIYAHHNDKSYPVLGFVGMTSLVVDITDSDVEIGDIMYFSINPMYVDSKVNRRY